MKYERFDKSVSEHKEKVEANAERNLEFIDSKSRLGQVSVIVRELGERDIEMHIEDAEQVYFEESVSIEEEREAIEEERNNLRKEIADDMDALEKTIEKLTGLEASSKYGKQFTITRLKCDDISHRLYALLIELNYGDDCESRNGIANASIQFNSLHAEVQETFNTLNDIRVMPLKETTREQICHYGPDVTPNRQTPRDLGETQYTFTADNMGTLTYDSPMEMAKFLCSTQGTAYPDRFRGTCGLCSCANVLALAGVSYSEKDIIDYAASTKMEGHLFSRLCVVNPLSADKSGGTTAKQRKEILQHFGVDSSTFKVREDANGDASIEAIEDIGRYVSEGRGVIIDVDGGVFYENPKLNGYGHAVTVTSVTKNKYGDVSGFYIADSNRGTVFYPALRIQKAIRTFVDINVTTQIIR